MSADESMTQTRVDDRREEEGLDGLETQVPTATVLGEAVEERDLPEVHEGRYREEGSLGVGGMGEVKLCLDHTVGRRVAMKVARHGLARRGDVRARFLLEARLQGQLEHPSIVPVYDLGHAEGAPYFTMRRVKGRTLEEVLAHGAEGASDVRERFSERRLLSDFSQLCLALDFVHQRGVVHRDVKPANVMLGEYGEVYLLDWGLAKVVGQEDEARPSDVGDDYSTLKDSAPETQYGVLLGTPGYVAPEVVRGVPEISTRADIYALGALLFEVITGQRLHVGDKIIKILNATLVGTDERVKRAVMAPELETLVLWATCLDPEARPTARELHEGIERYLDGHRDSDRRRELADALVAEVAAARPSEGGGVGEQRSDALAKLGRALALDPTHERALTHLVDLLTHPPPSLPDEVKKELAEQEARQTAHAGRMGAVVFLALNAMLPLGIWTGVRRWWPLVLFSILTTATGITSWLVSRLERPNTWHALIVYVLALSTATVTGAIFGPFLIAPLLIVVVTLLFSLNHPPEYRRIFVTLGMLAAVLPLGLEWAGIIEPSMAFGPDGMTVLKRVSEVRRIPTLAALTIASVGTILIAGGAIGPIRKELDRAQAQIRVQAWQLRQMVPTSRDGVEDRVGGAEGTGAEDAKPGEASE